MSECKVVFKNETFDVKVLEQEVADTLEDEDKGKAYAVVNREFNIVEYRAGNLLEALSAAEQFNYALVNESYKAPDDGRESTLELAVDNTTEH